MKKKLKIIPFILFILILVILTSCKPRGEEGELIGISAEISLEQAQAGEVADIAYLGSVSVKLLETDEVIDAKCPKEFLLEVVGAPVFNVDEISGGYVASIEIQLDKPTKVLVDQNSELEWEVVEILK
jgi:hypothetical protein